MSDKGGDVGDVRLQTRLSYPSLLFGNFATKQAASFRQTSYFLSIALICWLASAFLGEAVLLDCRERRKHDLGLAG